MSEGADPLLGEHSIHWRICGETYKSPPRAPMLDSWELILDLEDTVAYQTEEFVIIGFRGTHEGKDIIDDLKLSHGANDTCAFPRVDQAREFTDTLLAENDEIIIQLTGHSLGGAIARCVGKALDLGVVTFNAAAPPTNPVRSNPNETDYHIAFDIISAWQSPNTIRIDKGFRPYKSRSVIPFRWIKQSFKELHEAHSLNSFSSFRSGKIISPGEENEMVQKWWKGLPFIFKAFVEQFLYTQSNFKNRGLPLIN